MVKNYKPPRTQVHLTGAARSVPLTAGACPVKPGIVALRRKQIEMIGQPDRLSSSSMEPVRAFRQRGPPGPDHAPKSAAELTLGGWHFARGLWIDRNRRTKRPGQTLEAGFGDMMAVLAI